MAVRKLYRIQGKEPGREGRELSWEPLRSELSSANIGLSFRSTSKMKAQQCMLVISVCGRIMKICVYH